MRARWAVCVFLLCAWTVELRAPGALPPLKDALSGEEGPGLSRGEEGPGLSRGEEGPGLGRGEEGPGLSRGEEGPGLSRGAGGRAPSTAGGHRNPRDTDLRPGVSRGSKGPWRRRVHRTSEPDRYFTTPRTVPPPVTGSAGLQPLSAGALWGYAALLLALIMFSVGLVGNLALMCLVWHSFHLKSAWNCVLAGLALWDFVVLFICLPVVLLHLLTGTRLMGALSCSLVPFLEVSSMGVATFSLCALSIDRFHSATSPSHMHTPVEPCMSILSKLSVIFIGALLLAVPELLLYRQAILPPQERQGHYSTQEARSWWVFGCYLCLPLLFTLSCDLVTRRVASQQTRQLMGRHEGSSRSSSPSEVKRDVSSNRSPSPSTFRQEVCSRTSSLNRKLREAGQRSVILALVGLYSACTLPGAVCAVALSYMPVLPVGVAPLLLLIGQFLLFARCSATPLLALSFSKPLGGAFMHCCCCCCNECCVPAPQDTPTASLATPSTLLATPLSALAPPLTDCAPEQQEARGTPC